MISDGGRDVLTGLCLGRSRHSLRSSVQAAADFAVLARNSGLGIRARHRTRQYLHKYVVASFWHCLAGLC